jgi:cytochrome P450
MEHIDDYQPFNPAFKANPFPYYARLRADEPISRHVQSDGRGYWLVTRYDDVLAVLRDPRFIKNWRAQLTPDERAELPPLPPAFAIFIANMLDQDPPNHTRLRALVSKAFTPRLIENLRPRIQQLADGLLDTASTRGEMDLIDDYAFPIPITVIAELLGVPTEDREKFRTWSNAAVSGDFSLEAAEQIAPHSGSLRGLSSSAF